MILNPNPQGYEVTLLDKLQCLRVKWHGKPVSSTSIYFLLDHTEELEVLSGWEYSFNDRNVVGSIPDDTPYPWTTQFISLCSSLFTYLKKNIAPVFQGPSYEYIVSC